MKEEIIQNINQGLEAAYINGNLASNLEYKPSFISNNPEEGKKLFLLLRKSCFVVNNFRLVWHLSQWEESHPCCRR